MRPGPKRDTVLPGAMFDGAFYAKRVQAVLEKMRSHPLDSGTADERLAEPVACYEAAAAYRCDYGTGPRPPYLEACVARRPVLVAELASEVIRHREMPRDTWSRLRVLEECGVFNVCRNGQELLSGVEIAGIVVRAGLVSGENIQLKRVVDSIDTEGARVAVNHEFHKELKWRESVVESWLSAAQAYFRLYRVVPGFIRGCRDIRRK